MGSPAASLPPDANAAGAEWIELKNVSSRTVALGGWSMVDAAGRIALRFEEGDRIPAGGLLLLARGNTTFPYAHVTQHPYSGDLRNTGDDLAVMDPACAVSDLVAASEGWPAGENASKRTMERDPDGAGWHTSASPGGTPGAENSIPLPSHYRLDIAFEGAAGGSISATPQGLSCTASGCTGTFAAGALIALRAAPPAGGVFDGWSGACAGRGPCTLTLQGDSVATAAFRIPLPAEDTSVASNDLPASSLTSTSSPESSSVSSTPVLESGSGAALLIAAVQIAGASSTNDYVKIYNAGAAAADVHGWKLKKRSQTGAEYSLRTFPAGASIAPGGYFVWANAEGGFAASLGADASSTETLSANNSVALLDPAGAAIDAVAWGTGDAPFKEGTPYPDGPSSGHVLARRMAAGAMQDTGNNADDFEVR